MANKNGVSFRVGGVHPPTEKQLTENVPIQEAKIPDTVIIPMSQHIGAPCTPIVKKGDHVYVGTKVGEANGFVSVPVHSSVSGTVKMIDDRQHPNGNRVQSVIIESDGLDEMDPSITPVEDYTKLEPKELINLIKEGGIVGIGGATFPTHVKLSIPPDKHVDTIILNGAECEPYLTCDDHLMRARPDLIVKGLEIIMYITGVTTGKIGIENNKPDAIRAVAEAASHNPQIEVVPMQTKYPQGAEKQLIQALTGREVPSGGLPADAGVIVNNVATAAQIAVTITQGIPFYRTMLTCTGNCIKNPATYLVRLGDTFQSIIDQAGGFTAEPKKIISGGPMMGVAQFTTDVPVIKSTSGILCFDEKLAVIDNPVNCIKCGKCSEACPMGLQPYIIATFAALGRFDKSDEYHAMDCIECGSCAYTCPSRRPILTCIRTAKRVITEERRKAK